MLVLCLNQNSSKVFMEGPQQDGSYINKLGGEEKYRQALYESSIQSLKLPCIKKNATSGSLPAAWPRLYWTANKIEAETKTRPTEVLGDDSGYSPSCDGKSITLTCSCVVLMSPVNQPLACEWPRKLYPVTTFDLTVLQSLIKSVQIRDKGKQQEQVTEDAHFLAEV